jgi:trimeric autotransporter adhesin
MKKQNIIAVCLLLSTFGAEAQNISTYAGNGTGGYAGDGAAATAAELNTPYGVALDGSGNLYIADGNNARIRKVNSAGVISTFAGNGIGISNGDGGSATAASIGNPFSITFDGSGNAYIVNNTNHNVRKVNSAGVISTIAGTGTAGYNGDGIVATTAQLNYPTSVAVDGSGNVYIADGSNNCVRKINSSGIISKFAGGGMSGVGDGGAATAAQLLLPYGVAVDASGNVYIADATDHRIRKVNTSGIISTIAGNGTTGYSGDGAAATLAQISPNGICLDASGNIYFTDGTTRIRKINSAGIVTTVAGNGANGFSGDGMAATMAQLANPNGVAVDATGNLYIADLMNNRIRKVTASVSTTVSQSLLPDSKIVVYPNPSKGIFEIRGVIGSKANEPIAVSVFNVLGQLVYSEDIFTQAGIINAKIALANLKGGLYTISIISQTESTIQRIVIDQ